MTTLLWPQLSASPFTFAAALAAGLSRHTLAALVRDRVVRRVLVGVYVSSAVVDSVELRVAAVRLVTAPHVVICDRTAAWLHGVDAFRYTELEVLPPIETCVPPDRTRLRRGECRGGRRDLEPGDVTELYGLRVTTPLRTAVDLGMRLRRSTALATLDAFLRMEAFNITALHSELRRFPGRRGIIQLRQLATIADGASESPGESWLRLGIVDAGLPSPCLQHVVTWQGRELFRLDLAYVKHKICIEYDGREFHDSQRQRQYDEDRRTWLREHGWIVIVARQEDLTPDAMAGLITRVRTALASRR